ncbi:hypothetical protein L6164_026168 [Bauhinia variegata]|uniref:Uncharacterized protein n=1 Tax=Bauhinia variegata TaxID=167791 RepID=A0ACB9LQ91_BAUVA|nr:hypothetical protein L6164_026168 [Bauhinia variegata]
MISSRPMANTATIIETEDFSKKLLNKDLWHRRLGHPSQRVLDLALKGCNVKIKVNENFHFCDSCQYGKMHLLPFPISKAHAAAPLELIHTYLWGPAPILSISWFQ